jgi:hypothetical protein
MAWTRTKIYSNFGDNHEQKYTNFSVNNHDLICTPSLADKHE